MALTVFEFMEDFDNAELNDYDRDEQIRDAVIQYNEENGTSYDPDKTLSAYKGKRNQMYCE